MKYKLLGEEKAQSNYPTHQKTDHGGPSVEEKTFDDELGCIEAEENDKKLEPEDLQQQENGPWRAPNEGTTVPNIKFLTSF